MRATSVLIFLLGLISPIAHADPVIVHNLRMWQAPDNTRLVFDLSAPLEHRVFVLKDPDRIVIDMENAQLEGQLPQLDLKGSLLSGVRSASHDDNRLRVVLDLTQPVRPRTFVLKPYEQYGYRLVIDLYGGQAQEEKPKSAPAPTRKNWVIAIDPGHGGEDSGAVGHRYGTREKDVVLAIGRDLKKLIDTAPGMQALMTRDGDYYVGLKERYEKARKHEADLFISVHADSLPGQIASGASVYALSERGASSVQAKVLADKENAADLIGGVSLSDKDPLVAKVLFDLSQTATIGSSLEFGSDVLTALGDVGPIHLSSVQQAGFAVLKAPDMPSILIETAFISNAAEERKLRNPRYQSKYAQAIFNGIERYLTRHRRAPATTPVAASAPRVYVVQPGDTLAAIARNYGIRAEVLRFANELDGSALQVGTRLVIP